MQILCDYECLDSYSFCTSAESTLMTLVGMQLIARAYPYIAKRLLTDEAEELRGALEEFLIQNGSFRFRKILTLSFFVSQNNGMPPGSSLFCLPVRVSRICRWARLEDLINEGRKVGGIREEQLWSFLHWLVSEQKVTHACCFHSDKTFLSSLSCPQLPA